MSKTIKRLLFVLIFVFALIGLSSCSGEAQQSFDANNKVIDINGQTISSADVNKQITSAGLVITVDLAKTGMDTWKQINFYTNGEAEATIEVTAYLKKVDDETNYPFIENATNKGEDPHILLIGSKTLEETETYDYIVLTFKSLDEDTHDLSSFRFSNINQVVGEEDSTSKWFNAGLAYTQPINGFKTESGILAPLVYVISLLMHWIASWGLSRALGAFAVAIILSTIIVRTVAWPIYAKTNDMTLKMAVAQPEIDRLNAKYASRKDPQSQQRMQQEMMAIYKKHKINMFGCLMPFLQMPLFLAMYRVVTRITVSAYVGLVGGKVVFHDAALRITDANMFGIQDCLSKGVMGYSFTASSVVGIILAAIVGGTMFLLNYISQKQPSYVKKKPNQQSNQMNKTMKIFNYVMIVMMVVFSLQNNAIALYWVIGNVYSIGQTIINKKLNERKYYKMRSDVDDIV